ncbi:MAG: hypothetical protein V3W45_06145 [Sedimentisphaerales bacterium]
MMNCTVILAQAVETAGQTQAAEEAVVPIETIWTYITSLNPLEAITFISFGVVCLFYGWRVFKILVIISFAILGMGLGIVLAGKVGGDNNQILGGAAGFVVLAIISVPLMRWAVSLLGAAAGGILTSGIWYACQLNEEYILAGALIGIIAGGMISFIIFKVAVMLFSSLGGSGLMVTGILALLYLYPETTEQVKELVFNESWFLPAALLIPTVVGIIVQNKFYKRSSDWSV